MTARLQSTKSIVTRTCAWSSSRHFGKKTNKTKQKKHEKTIPDVDYCCFLKCDLWVWPSFSNSLERSVSARTVKETKLIHLILLNHWLLGRFHCNTGWYFSFPFKTHNGNSPQPTKQINGFSLQSFERSSEHLTVCLRWTSQSVAPLLCSHLQAVLNPFEVKHTGL